MERLDAGGEDNSIMIDAWCYARGREAADIVEWADVRGRAVALPPHFHNEDQVTLVFRGRRRFEVDGAVIALGPGEALALAAGTPHASLDEPGGVVCRNAYLPAGSVALPELVAALSQPRRDVGRTPWDEAAFLDLIGAHRGVGHPRVAADSGASRDLASHDLDGGTSRAAARLGLTREGFSRAFRRRHGLAPQTFRRLSRLNVARALLRDGMAPAAVAAETGFADQSHLGRCFRQVFGITPARYRAG